MLQVSGSLCSRNMTRESQQHGRSLCAQSDMDTDLFSPSHCLGDPGFQLGAWGSQDDSKQTGESLVVRGPIRSPTEEPGNRDSNSNVDAESCCSMEEENTELKGDDDKDTTTKEEAENNYTAKEGPSDCNIPLNTLSLSAQDDSSRHVRFCDCLVTEVNYAQHYPPEDWRMLFYGAHELQKMLEESAAELKQNQQPSS